MMFFKNLKSGNNCVTYPFTAKWAYGMAMVAEKGPSGAIYLLQKVSETTSNLLWIHYSYSQLFKAGTDRSIHLSTEKVLVLVVYNDDIGQNHRSVISRPCQVKDYYCAARSGKNNLLAGKVDKFEEF